MQAMKDPIPKNAFFTIFVLFACLALVYHNVPFFRPEMTPEEEFRVKMENEIEARHKQEIADVEAKAAQGDPDAQFVLATMYMKGDDLHKDYPKATMLFRALADHGDKKSMVSLGEIYQSGRGVKQDNLEAYFWYALSDWTGEAASVRTGFDAVITPDQVSATNKRIDDWHRAHFAQPVPQEEKAEDVTGLMPHSP